MAVFYLCGVSKCIEFQEKIIKLHVRIFIILWRQKIPPPRLIFTRNVELIFSRLRCFWPFGGHTFHWGQTHRKGIFLYEEHNEFLCVSVPKSSSNLFHATHNMNLITIVCCQYGYINYSSIPGSTPLSSFLWTFNFVMKVK